MKTLLALLVVLAPAQDKPARELLQDALAKAKESNKRVPLTFGGAGCGWCTIFEAWKAQPEVAALLGKDFVNVYIDPGKAAGGDELKRAYAQALAAGIPWFVVLDGDGKELADSTGPMGNIGCPDTDEEIEVWTGILRKVRVTLSDDDVEALRKSRIADREARKRR